MSSMLSLLIGWRFSQAKRQSTMAKFLSWSSCIGVALGVMVLIIGLSAMNGFENELKHRVLGVIPNVEFKSVTSKIEEVPTVQEALQDEENVLGSTPLVVLNAILSKDALFKGVNVRGVDPDTARSVFNAEEFIEGASFKDLRSENEHQKSIIVGAQIAEKINAHIGDNIELVIAKASENGTLNIPTGYVFKVIGIFKIGGDIDNLMSFIDIKDARDILDLKDTEANLLALKVKDIYQAQAQGFEAAKHIAHITHTSYYVHSWMLTMGRLYNDIQMIRSILYLALVLIITVASFNIVSNLMMMTNEKRSEVAILLSLGIKKFTIFKSFMTLGLISGGIGIVIGTVLGCFIASNLTSIIAVIEQLFGFKLLNSHTYFIDYVPSILKYQDVLLVTGVTLVICLIATLIPAYFANRVSPARELSQK